MYLYRIDTEYIQTRCSNSHTQVPPTGAGNPPTVLYWYIHSKRTIEKLELPHRNKYQTMDDLENDEVHDVDGSPYKTGQIGLMFPSHIIILPETCWINPRCDKVTLIKGFASMSRCYNHPVIMVLDCKAWYEVENIFEVHILWKKPIETSSHCKANCIKSGWPQTTKQKR